jgi:hypothetical protein
MNHDARQLTGQLRVKLGEVTFPVSTSAAEELRTHVREYAAALRFDGMTPEAAVIDVKRVLFDAGLEPTTHAKSTEAALTPRDHLCGSVVAWCIEGYYSDGRSDGPGASGHQG